MMDRYQSFNELKHHETAFTVELRDCGSRVSILAPHGGRIEPHTAEITRLIAGQDYNYFCFNGLKEGCNRDLHITSHRYDEEQALALVKKSERVISVHGCTRRENLIFLGGLDNHLKQMIAQEFTEAGIPHTHSVGRFSGIHPDNICNRGISGQGVQLEISRGLRDTPGSWTALARSVRTALKIDTKASR